MVMNIQTPLPLRLRSRAVVLTVSALILAWLVVSRSFAAFLADAAPQAALWINGRQPEALVNLADQELNVADATRANTIAADKTSRQRENALDTTKPSSATAIRFGENLDKTFSAFETVGRNQSINRPILPENATAIRMWAINALLNEPLNARALRILGQLAEAEDDDANALKSMQAANRLSLHETFAAYWLLRKAVQSRDYKAAIYFADALLRTNPGNGAFVVPVLAQVGEEKDGAPLVKAVLASNPPWREEFISMLPGSVTDARTPLNFLLALRTNPVPLTTGEIEPYLDLLVTHKLYGLAYYTWLQFLPPDELRQVGLLFNGGFEVAPSGVPFDWKIVPGSGVTIDIVSRPDNPGERALLIDFEFGRVDYHSVTELVMLAPGTYQFNGEYKGALVGPRGLKWRIVCADGTVTNGGESPVVNGTTSNWKAITFTFTIPDKDCVAQYVRLDLDARMASEQLVSGSVLFGKLRISRMAGPSSSGG
jgi:tetratricopeptide (TPR) repeat protein